MFLSAWGPCTRPTLWPCCPWSSAASLRCGRLPPRCHLRLPLSLPPLYGRACPRQCPSGPSCSDTRSKLGNISLRVSKVLSSLQQANAMALLSLQPLQAASPLSPLAAAVAATTLRQSMPKAVSLRPFMLHQVRIGECQPSGSLSAGEIAASQCYGPAVPGHLQPLCAANALLVASPLSPLAATTLRQSAHKGMSPRPTVPLGRRL